MELLGSLQVNHLKSGFLRLSLLRRRRLGNWLQRLAVFLRKLGRTISQMMTQAEERHKHLKKKITFVDGDVEGPTNPEYVEMKLVRMRARRTTKWRGRQRYNPLARLRDLQRRRLKRSSVASDE